MAGKSSTDSAIYNADASLGYLPKAKALVNLSLKPKSTPGSPTRTDLSRTQYESWGDDNKYPNEVLEHAEKNSIIPSTLMWKANQMSAGGVLYGIIKGRNRDGTEIFEPIEVAEVEEWLEQNALDLYFEETLRDLNWWANAFADIYLTPGRDKIAALLNQEAMDCRFSKQNPKNGKKEFVFLDGNWPNGKADTWTQIPCLDPYFGVQEQIKKSSATRFIYPMSFSSPGEKYYQKATWHSIITSGWLAVAEKIPVFKKALMDNGMNLKYIINVPESWWSFRYKKWSGMTDEEKKGAQREAMTEINNVLTGVKNAGKGLMLTFKHDSYGKQYTKWEVIPLKSNLESGAYIEDSQEVSSHILYSLLVDGTLIGNSPGKQMGAGSGSDKLRANNIFILNNKVYLEKALKPLYIISKFNGWKGPKGEKLHWRGQSYMLATLDSGKAMKAETAGPGEKEQKDGNGE